MSRAYYNEIDPFAAAWLRELIAAGHIAAGDVDERSIVDVHPGDLAGYTQCHFFAGIGGWSYALRLAGWPDDRPVWTGSCPCQPFSAAGKGAGGADHRHLWPHWARLIRECRPVTIFGEQVESAIGHGWLDAVFDDLERDGYACGAACLPAASVGAPHIRQRLWFVADAERGTAERRGYDVGGAAGSLEGQTQEWQWFRNESGAGGEPCLVADADTAGRDGRGAARLHERREAEGGEESAAGGVDRPCRDDTDGRGQDGGMADAMPAGRAEGWTGAGDGSPAGRGGSGVMGYTSSAGLQEQRGVSSLPRRSVGAGAWQASVGAGAWADCEWIACRDGKARPTEPGLFPLAHGVSGRVGRLRGYGNAIVPHVAAEVIAAFMEVQHDQ